MYGVGHDAATNDFVFHMSGDKKNSKAGLPNAQPFGQLPAVHMGHYHVGYEKVYRAAFFMKFERLSAVGRLNDVVPLANQYFARVVTNAFVVLHQQDPFAAGRRWKLQPTLRTNHRDSFSARQIDAECGSAADFAVYFDAAAELLN